MSMMAVRPSEKDRESHLLKNASPIVPIQEGDISLTNIQLLRTWVPPKKFYFGGLRYKAEICPNFDTQVPWDMF